MSATLHELELRMTKVELQVGRIASDIESEKDSRARANSEILSQLRAIDTAQRKQEKMLWGGAGGLAVLQFLVPMVVR